MRRGKKRGESGSSTAHLDEFAKTSSANNAKDRLQSARSSSYHSACGDHAPHRRQDVSVHCLLQPGQRARVSNVFHTCPHPGAQHQVSSRVGCHWHFGQRIRTRPRSASSSFSTIVFRGEKRKASIRAPVAQALRPAPRSHPPPHRHRSHSPRPARRQAAREQHDGAQPHRGQNQSSRIELPQRHMSVGAHDLHLPRPPSCLVIGWPRETPQLSAPARTRRRVLVMVGK